MSAEYLIGVDTGGTFTDCVVLDNDGRIVTAKAPSTPPNFAQGVVDAVARAGEALGGLSARDVLARTQFFGHGTTVGTNTLLTRSGARVGLIRLLAALAGRPFRASGGFDCRRRRSVQTSS